jgi:hypothetical protein
MKFLAIGCIILSALVSTEAFSRGSGGSGMAMHRSTAPTTGGAFGARPTAPGTNSAGTPLSSGGSGAGGGPALGTGDPAVEQEDRKAARMISSICKGC